MRIIPPKDTYNWILPPFIFFIIFAVLPTIGLLVMGDPFGLLLLGWFGAGLGLTLLRRYLNNNP